VLAAFFKVFRHFRTVPCESMQHECDMAPALIFLSLETNKGFMLYYVVSNIAFGSEMVITLPSDLRMRARDEYAT